MACVALHLLVRHFFLPKKSKQKMGGMIYLATNRFFLRGHHRLIVHVTPGHILIQKAPKTDEKASNVVVLDTVSPKPASFSTPNPGRGKSVWV